MSGQAEPPQFLMPILETPSHVVEAPSAPYGYSKYLYGVVNSVVSSLNSFISNSNANDLQTRTELGKAFDDRAVIRTELTTAIAGEKASREAGDASLNASVTQLRSDVEGQAFADKAELQSAIDVEKARVDELRLWRDNNTDEISTEVDKAINSKVSQLSFDTIKSDLEQADSAISANLASAITARTEKDKEHDLLIQRMEKFVNTVLTTYTLQDGGGNPINSFADVAIADENVDFAVWGITVGQEYQPSNNNTKTYRWDGYGKLIMTDINNPTITIELLYENVNGVPTYTKNTTAIRLGSDGQILYGPDETPFNITPVA